MMIRQFVVCFSLLSLVSVLGWIAANLGRPVDDEAEKEEYLEYLAYRAYLEHLRTIRSPRPATLSTPAVKGFHAGGWNDPLSPDQRIERITAHGYVVHRGKKTEIH